MIRIKISEISAKFVKISAVAIPDLNFKGSIKSLGGKFTPDSARKIIDSQFKKLPSSARAYMIEKIGSGKTIHADDFNEIITEAHKKGYLSSEHAEQIKDSAHICEKWNDHL